MQVTQLKKWLLMLVAVAALGLVAAGCGDDDDDSSGGNGGGGGDSSGALPGASAPLSEAEQAIEELRQPVTELTPNGEPFDAKAVTDGKTVGWVTVTNNIPFTTTMFEGARPAAEMLGLELNVCDGKGQPAEWERCYSRLISQGVDAIVSQSIDPRILKASIDAAGEAGIPVITTSSNFPGEDLWPGTAAEDPQPFREVGEALGQWIAADSGGEANVLVLTSNEVYTGPGQVKATTDALEKYCPETCEYKVVDVPIAEWANRVPTVVQAELTQNPDLSYVYPLYDGAVPFAVSAIHAKGATDKTKVVSFNALPGIMEYLKNEDVLAADIGVWVEQHGYAAIDAVARVLNGEEDTDALKDSSLAMRMFDTSNVASLDFEDPASWYGSADLSEFYGKQWMLE